MVDTVLSAEYVRQCFSYDAETGDLIWKRRPLKHFASLRAEKRWNTQFSGTKVAHQRSDGYLGVRINNKAYLAHRIIWLIAYGEWPAKDIDHINHNRSDNMLCNLREVTHKENIRNSRKSKNNTSGSNGVHFRKDTKRYTARLMVNGVTKNLGCFDKFDDAVNAVGCAKMTNGFHENHGK